MGRRMKRSEKLFTTPPAPASALGPDLGQLAGFSRIHDPRWDALAQAELAVGHDLVAGVDAAFDDGNAVLHRAELDRAPLGRAVGPNDVAEIAARSFHHGAPRHRDA